MQAGASTRLQADSGIVKPRSTQAGIWGKVLQPRKYELPGKQANEPTMTGMS